MQNIEIFQKKKIFFFNFEQYFFIYKELTQLRRASSIKYNINL